jgi:hypothetical protein
VINENIQKLLTVVNTMYTEYDFYIPPVFEEYESFEENYISTIYTMGVSARQGENETEIVFGEDFIR